MSCLLADPILVCLFLVFLVVPQDWREASRVERWLVWVVVSSMSIVVTRVVAVGRVVARVVVTGSIHGIARIAKSKVLGLKETIMIISAMTILLIVSTLTPSLACWV